MTTEYAPRRFRIAFTNLYHTKIHGSVAPGEFDPTGHFLSPMGYLTLHEWCQYTWKDFPGLTLELVEPYEIANYSLCSLHSFRIRLLQRAWRKQFYRLDYVHLP